MKRRLYVSFTNLVHRMKDRDIRPKDLEDALFYFGCTKEHIEKPFQDNEDVADAFDLKKEKEGAKEKPACEDEDLKMARIVYGAIYAAVVKAETDGRAAFRQIGQHLSFRELNQLLARNGIDTSSVRYLEIKEKNKETGELYSYPGVRDHYGGLVEVMTR